MFYIVFLKIFFFYIYFYILFLFYLKKNKVFFYLTCCFWGSRISHMYVPLYTYVRAADTCFVLYDILSSFRIYFRFFIVSLRRKSVI